MIGRREDLSGDATQGLRGFVDFELRLGDVMRGERATMGKSLLDVQRELKIRASYIAAIENADIAAFESKGFVAGFVRSYARYLGLDPEWAFRSFCGESGFDGVDAFVRGGAQAQRGQMRGTGEAPAGRARKRGAAEGGFGDRFVMAQPGMFDRLQPAALGSVLVLALLAVGIGYGGWTLFTEVQRVRLAPIDEAPGVADLAATLDPVAAPVAGAGAAAPSAPDPEALTRIYRPQTLDLPVVVARDGPIATLDPAEIGVLIPDTPPGEGESPASAEDPAAETNAAQVQVARSERPQVELLAVRPAWVRVSAADGSVLFEKILDAGERYAVPESDVAPRLRAGNSGWLFFLVDGQPYGPAGPGTSVAKRVSLAVSDLVEGYERAEVPAEMLELPEATVAESGPPPVE